MRYQLVLQWPCESGPIDFETLVEIEDAVAEHLPNGSGVDGHDMGSREMNIFILTGEPLACFQAVEAVLRAHGAWTRVRVAYRDLTGEQYTILWPQDLVEFKVA